MVVSAPSSVRALTTFTTTRRARTSHNPPQQPAQCFTIRHSTTTTLFSSPFYDNNDDEDDEEDEDDDEDDMIEMDDASVADFRSKMDSMFGTTPTTTNSPTIIDEEKARLSAFFDEDDDDDVDLMSEEGGSVEELIRFARNQAASQQQKDDDDGNHNNNNNNDQEPEDWARPEPTIRPGTVLVANPAKFCRDFVEGGRTMGVTPDPRLLSKFGLTLPPPADLGADRRADLLPVLIVVEHDTEEDDDDDESSDEDNDRDKSKDGAGNAFNTFLSNLGAGNSNNKNFKNSETVAVLLNRRTGYLLGDLEPSPGGMMGGGGGDDGSSAASVPAPLLEKFCIQPLWFGGVDNLSPGLDMLHQCPTVQGAKLLTKDGLYWGGEPTQAQDAMEDPSLPRIMTGFDFKFFVQATRFSRAELEQQCSDKVWFPASVSKQVLFKSRDRMGTQRAKPLWTEIMELLGGDCRDVRDQLYQDENDKKS